MAFEEKTLSSSIVYEGPVFRIRKHTVSTPAGESVRDIIEHSGGAIMLALTNEGRIIVERQYRKALESFFVELPAGKADPGEDPETTAIRELTEETGYIPGKVEHLVSFYPTCGYSNEYLHIYFCTGLTKGERHLDEDESIDIYEYYPEELLEMIRTGEIKDGKTIIGLLFAKQFGLI